MKVFLEIFLLFDVFLAGVFASTAIRHALAHFRPHEHDAERNHHPAPTGHLPPELKQKMLEEAQADFKAVIKHSTDEMQQDLGSASAEIKKTIEDFGKQSIAEELNNYKAKLDELEKQTEVSFGDFKQQVSEHHEDLKVKITEQVEAEKQRLLQQVDTKLADAMVSFLLEAMQHNVDLGAQVPYLTSMLDEHKADFTQELVNDAKA